MRSDDAGLILQVMAERSTGIKPKTPQHTGVYIAYVTDNALNNPTIPSNRVKFRIPALGNQAGWPAAPYDGRGVPPIDTECVVSFEGIFANQPRVVSFTDWQSGPVIFYSTTEPSADDLQPGDLWIDPS